MSVKTIEKRDSKYDKRYEEIEKEWDKEKNGDLSLKEVTTVTYFLCKFIKSY